MNYLVLNVDKFTYKDKSTQEIKNATVVYLMKGDGKTVLPIFMNEEFYKTHSFDSYALDKSEIDSLFANYKSCSVEFDDKGKLVSVSDSK